MRKPILELVGAELDYAVAEAQGLRASIGGGMCNVIDPKQGPLGAWRTYSPSTRWEEAGPIMERTRIGPIWVDSTEPKWVAMPADSDEIGTGPTALLASMRCFVSMKFGKYIELPEAA